MTTYSLNKPSYFLFQDSASGVSYACEKKIIICDKKHRHYNISAPKFNARVIYICTHTHTYRVLTYLEIIFIRRAVFLYSFRIKHTEIPFTYRSCNIYKPPLFTQPHTCQTHAQIICYRVRTYTNAHAQTTHTCTYVNHTCTQTSYNIQLHVVHMFKYINT